MSEISFEEWLQQGISLGFCGPAICFMHDGVPTTVAEDEELEEGDPCIHILRLYEDEATKLGVETNHSPSVWRATNSGYKL